MMPAVCFSQMLFIMFGSSLLFLVFCLNLSWKCWFCQKLVCISWNDHVVFVSLFSKYGELYRFSYVEPPPYSWDKSHMVMVYNVLISCWIPFASLLLKISSSTFLRGIGLSFLALLCLYLVLVSGNADLLEWVRKYFIIFYFLEEFKKEFCQCFKCFCRICHWSLAFSLLGGI